ncbi:MAG: AsmA-like C-terminal region-containing protein [Polaromonas sp.]|nr:AsmA-like C-terminal region-containing protein [Polaromonas sp.]MDP3752836.1 AsmA-like C-terminal region-containing protein [Polaromonas sp.]
MRHQTKWMIAAGVLLLLLGAVWLALVRLVPSDEELAHRVAADLQSRLGVPVKIGSLRWTLIPVPAVVLADVATGQPQPIGVKKLTLYPSLADLVDGRLKFERVEVETAVLPQLALRDLNKAGESASLGTTATPLVRLVFRDVTWISRFGQPLVFDGEVDFDPNWRPREAQLRRPGVEPLTRLTLTRQGQEDRWTTRIDLGGGTANGEVQLETRANDRLHLTGTLQPQGVEVSSAMAAFDRRSVVSGKASGQTALSATGDTIGELAQSLHTRTSFSMGKGTLLKIDVDKAIRSFGKERAGQTAMDSITGQLDTQNTAKGMVVSFTDIRASSGAFSASGKAKIANRQIDGEFSVDLVDGLVGVPLQVNGPLDKMEVSVPRSAIAGAAVGTAILPGVGTAIGAKVGAALGQLFSPGTSSSTAPAKKKP